MPVATKYLFCTYSYMCAYNKLGIVGINYQTIMSAWNSGTEAASVSLYKGKASSTGRLKEQITAPAPFQTVLTVLEVLQCQIMQASGRLTLMAKTRDLHTPHFDLGSFLNVLIHLPKNKSYARYCTIHVARGKMKMEKQ